jgi:hypothetical protein
MVGRGRHGRPECALLGCPRSRRRPLHRRRRTRGLGPSTSGHRSGSCVPRRRWPPLPGGGGFVRRRGDPLLRGTRGLRRGGRRVGRCAPLRPLVPASGCRRQVRHEGPEAEGRHRLRRGDPICRSRRRLGRSAPVSGRRRGLGRKGPFAGQRHRIRWRWPRSAHLRLGRRGPVLGRPHLRPQRGRCLRLRCGRPGPWRRSRLCGRGSSPGRCRRLRGRGQWREDRGERGEVARREGDEILVRGAVLLRRSRGLRRFSARARRGIRIGIGAVRDRSERLDRRLGRHRGSLRGNRMRDLLSGQLTEIGEEGADLGAEEVPTSRARCRALVRHDQSTYPQRGLIWRLVFDV